jgi:DNA polymerase I-like protein with 3'-5' exonuclease and polymerase domains
MIKFAAVDIETIGLHPYNGTIWMVGWCGADCKVKIASDPNGLKVCPPELRTLLQDKSICKVIHNAQFDIPYMELVWGVRCVNVWDTMVCEKVIQGVTADDRKVTEEFKIAHSASLKYTLARYGFPVPNKDITKQFINRPLGLKFTKEENEYLVDDVQYLLPLRKAQEFLLTRDKQLEAALLDNKVIERVCRMRVLGLGVDKKKWLEIANVNLNAYKRELATLPQSVKNWNSPAQVKEYFKQRYNITIDSFTNLKSIFLQTRNPLLAKFITIRQMYSDASGYGATWLYREDGSSTIDPDGRIRASFDISKNTGRFATSDPNLLGLPKEGDQRSAIIPRKGHVFVIGDFAGQEIGIMAAASKEDLWINALLRGDDVHGLMGSMLSLERWQAGTIKGCTFPKKCKCPVHNSMRNPAKEANFLLAYGGGASKLIERIIKNMFAKGIPTDEVIKTLMTERDARVFITKHKRAIRKLVAYLERNGRDAIRTEISYSADPYRRRRVLKGEQEWQIRNQGMNNPIQAAGANMIKLALVSMPDEFDIVLPFHDEIVCEVPKAKAKACVKAMTAVMEQSADYITGIHGIIKADVRVQTDYSKH